MSRKSHRPGCITGRFQPLHLAHLELMLVGADRHHQVIVAITNPDPGSRSIHPSNPSRHLASANPFSYLERERFVRAALRDAGVADERVSVVPFTLHEQDNWYAYVPPEAVQYVRVYSEWEQRKVKMLREHYTVDVIANGPSGKTVSATAIRKAIAAGGQWHDAVPGAVVQLIEARS
jgi:nicotinamide mononucleotide adenylyltransferase